MPSIKIDDFSGGLNTKDSPRTRPLGHLSSATGCEVDSGAVVPAPAIRVVNASQFPSARKAIYLFNGAWESSAGERWWAEMNGRLYWADPTTDGGVPQKKVGGTQYRLGVPAPNGSGQLSPVFATSTTQLDADLFGKNVTDIKYVITSYASGFGAESAPKEIGILSSDLGAWFQYELLATANVTSIVLKSYLLVPAYIGDNTSGIVRINGEIFTYTGRSSSVDEQYYLTTLTGVTRGVGGTPRQDHLAGSAAHGIITSVTVGTPKLEPVDPQVTERRVYRLSAGEFRKVATVNDVNITASISDGFRDSQLGYILVSEDNALPLNLTGLCGPYNNMLVGWKDDKVYFSLPGQPDAWPVDGYVALDNPVSCCVIWGGRVVAITSSGAYTITGTSPDNMRVSRAMGDHGTYWPRSVQPTRRGVVFLAPTGVAMTDGQSVALVSDDRLAASSFTTPTTVFAAAVNDKYYLYSTGGGMSIVGDLRGQVPAWISLPSGADVAFVDRDNNKLYTASGMALQDLHPTNVENSAISVEITPPQVGRLPLYYLLRLDVRGTGHLGYQVGSSVYSAVGFFNSSMRKSYRTRLAPVRGEAIRVTVSGGSLYVYGIEVEYS